MNNIHSFEAGYIFSHSGFTKLPHFLFETFFLLLPFIIASTILLLIIIFLKHIWNIKRLLHQKHVFLELTPPAFTEKTAYTTQQLFSILHTIGNQPTFWDKMQGRRIYFSLEIVSMKEQGIRYLIQTTPNEAKIIEQSIISYLPFVRVTYGVDYLHNKLKTTNKKIVAFKLAKHFAFPLAQQNILEQHDPVAYITGMMTKLNPGELIALQLVLTPVQTKETGIVANKILRNDDVLGYLLKPQYPGYLRPVIFILTIFAKIIVGIAQEAMTILQELVHGRYAPSNTSYYDAREYHLQETKKRPLRVLSSFENEIVTSIQEKIDQELFKSSLRVLLVQNDKKTLKQRIRGIRSALALFSVPKYQSLQAVYNFPPFLIDTVRFFLFKNRLPSPGSSSLLSLSEIAAIYHFPYAKKTQTEDIIKNLSPELPAPLLVKNEKNPDVVFGENSYGNSKTTIGLTDDERSRHFFCLGQTGSGKSTLFFHMAKDDIQKGRGVCVVDPHGDLVEDLLHVIPEERIGDVVYFNPFDIKYPIRINLIELTPGLTDDEQELEKEVVCESVISIFRRIFTKDENIDAHRIEYILRNAIYSAFYVQDATLFTVTKLLTNPDFRNKVIKNITNEELLDFWKYEFGKAGDWQITKMVSGVTAKVGRFSFSPIARRILEEPQSTIHIDQLIDQGKIILCNLSEGKLGEDTSQLFGTTIIAKIHLAILTRARMDKKFRSPFYLFVDEFQNFATPYFTKLLSGGRKYGLRVMIAEQSTTQQKDERTVNTILANVGTVVCFKTASPIDEQLLLPQFSPQVVKGDIINLPRFRFYIKLGAKDPQEPFSGKTIPIEIEKDQKKIDWLINASRKNYARIYTKETIPVSKAKKKTTTETKNNNKSSMHNKKRIKKKKDITSLT